MAYNYAAAYGTSYGQYAAQSSLGTQQTTASSYGQYGQAAAVHGAASSGPTVSTNTPTLSSHGYSAFGTSTTTAQSSYNVGYNHSYAGDSSNAYNPAAAASNTAQGFQAWYGNVTVASTPTANSQPAATAQTATQPYGQYLQQYQQQMAAYQQYANSFAGKKDNSQQQHQATAWGTYNQPQQQSSQQTTPAATALTNTANAGWGAYQQGASAQQNTTGNQQKSRGIVYRTPMKYPSNNQPYGTSNAAQNYPDNSQQQQPFKSPSANSSFTGSTPQQYDRGKSPNANSNFSGGTPQHFDRGYGNNKTQQFGANQSYSNSRQQQSYGGNHGMRNTSVSLSPNQRFQGSQNAPGSFNAPSYGNQSRGGFGGPNSHDNGPQRGVMRPLLTQRSPVGGAGPDYGSNVRPRGRPDIPPFPRAWHSRDGSNNPPRGGFNEQKERWGLGDQGGQGRFNQQNRGPGDHHGGPERFNQQNRGLGDHGRPERFNQQNRGLSDHGGPDRFNQQNRGPGDHGGFNQQNRGPGDRGGPGRFNQQNRGPGDRGGPGRFSQQNQGFGDHGGPPRFTQPNRGPGDRGGPGRFSQHNRGTHSNPSNSRGTNRELWSPARKSSTGALPEKEKPAISAALLKKENEEKVDKEKHPEIKSYLYAWLGVQHARPTYDIRQIAERPNILFRCELRVDKYTFVGVGKATSKKEAQTTAAWNFAEYLVEIGEIAQTDLPNKQIAPLPEDINDDIGDVKEEKEKESEGQTSQGRAADDNVDKNKGKKGPSRGRGIRPGHQSWGPGPDCGEIMPLMSVAVAPWGAPPTRPPRMMRPPQPLMPHPGLMDHGPPFWDDGPGPWMRPPMGMGPPMRPFLPMGPPLPLMRHGPPNHFWRQRNVEQRMMNLSQGQEWAHPEDMFISQMIRNQQEGERRQRGSRGGVQHPMESAPGEWERVQQQVRPAVTSDDRHVMAKHREIYPQEGELKNLHRIINTVEQALKLLSDKFVDEDHPKDNMASEETAEEELAKGEDEEKSEQPNEDKKEEESESKEKKVEAENNDVIESKEETAMAENEKESESKENVNTENKEEGEKKKEKRAVIKILKRPKRTPKRVDTRPRILCGVNRIGPLAKGLLITKDDRVQLALLCGEIPTEKLLGRIVSHIEEKLSEVDKEFKLVVEKRESEAGFLVRSEDESSPVEVMVILTATALRKDSDKKLDEKQKDNEEKKEEQEKEADEEAPREPDPAGLLPKRKMLDALACLRHTHWFQAKACGLQSCVILTRILRDMQRRDEMWSGITEWALEVLVFNCLSSSGEQLSPGDACRRFFEVLAGGILLPDMTGIVDPCEKSDRYDLLDCLSAQQRDDITRSAQSHLRYIAFRDIHMVLGMEKLLPSSKSDNHSENEPPSKDQDQSSGEVKVEEKPKPSESNNQRKRRFEPNESDSTAESPKRSLTDEEDTDTQQNLAELSISDGASEGRAAVLDETEGDLKDKVEENSELQEEDFAMETLEAGDDLTKDEEDALLNEDDKMSA